ncbi:hypothetical protein F511_42962 [Dorcoceras hygrometricum]|uniref:Uncharacterized protein n=1 Tax=Dorcoceras hygrometricum TaxID=472368 RepID=A0A2Z7BV58_9LAMI|nr:hypothetical protein F511_42962 [Dorcoceras hygrometricum]
MTKLFLEYLGRLEPPYDCRELLALEQLAERSRRCILLSAVSWPRYLAQFYVRYEF